MAETREYRGDILREWRDNHDPHITRQAFLKMLRESPLKDSPDNRLQYWSVDILDKLESGEKAFSVDYYLDLVEAGIFTKGDGYCERLEAGTVKRPRPVVTTTHNPHETDSSMEVVNIQVIKPRNVQVIVKLMITFAGLALIPQTWKLYRYESYVYRCSRYGGCGGGPAGRLSFDSPHIWMVLLLVFIVIAILALRNLTKQQAEGII